MKEVRETQLEFKHEIREVTALMANLDAKVDGHQWKVQEIITHITALGNQITSFFAESSRSCPIQVDVTPLWRRSTTQLCAINRHR